MQANPEGGARTETVLVPSCEKKVTGPGVSHSSNAGVLTGRGRLRRWFLRDANTRPPQALGHYFFNARCRDAAGSNRGCVG